ncbi:MULTISPECIES: peptidoglycan recognition protein [Streptomyces]|uniref:peptidoglycan recognition protein family protein n=1 Tax=Streptomyces TaxID=1883 RepID=UPI0013DAC328|nr:MULTISPECIES: peptidoglycan recognition protein [Streptomyces]MDI6515837.1 peptidoglycan recognition protein [Streptomyces coelicoflavus]
MVPPGGTPHIADRADPPDSRTMPVFRGPRRARERRTSRTPGAAGVPAPARALLGALPGLAAVAALFLCANGVQRAADAQTADAAPAAATDRYAAPRPDIVPRSVWLGDAARAQPAPRYDDKVVAVFVHHTDTPNGYDCADVPAILRGVYQGQTGARDWDDIGYNFVVDRCGTVYEGRAGGIDRPVTGAHTQGFNHRTTGIAALGTYTAGVPVPDELTDAIAAVTAWKLGESGTDPRGKAVLVSSNGLSRFAAGATATLPAVAGHDDGYATSCPGAALAARLGDIRDTAARLQGRA